MQPGLLECVDALRAARQRFASLAALSAAVLVACLAATASAQDLRSAVIVAAPLSGPERASVSLLADEVKARSGLSWSVRRAPSKAGPLVVVGRLGQIAGLLPPEARSAWRAPSGDAPEGFTVRAVGAKGRPVVIIAGNDGRGVLYGVGYLLRKLETGPDAAALSGPIDITTAPSDPVRGSQFGYRFKNNTYDAWTVGMFERRIAEFALFGANSIQVISPNSDDDAASPLFPAPPMRTLIGIGRAAHKYGLDFDLYYPEMAQDYAAPGAVAAELARFEALVRSLPRIDALYVPGGDPGHTLPEQLLPLVAQEAAILRRINPKARVWISGQGFDQARYESFYALLAKRPAWLTGVFFGPQSRDPMPVQRRRIPARYPLLFYPDIGHAMHAQFPVPQWDPAFALTEGREPIDPRPVAETAIFRHFAPLNRGFILYSEGVNDDVNSLLWFQLGWSAAIDPKTVMGDYARAFLGARIGQASSDRFADGLMALEGDWVGPPQDNARIDQTLSLFQTLEAGASPAQRTNWRFESALYRADYDAYVRRRTIAERARDEAALAALAKAPATGAEAAMVAARSALATPDDAATLALRARLFDLAGRLYDHVKLQLSVKLYGASGVERGANLDRVDVSLNDRVWLTRQFDRIAALPSEAAKLAALAAIVDWPDRRDGALYDDLGDPTGEPHLVRGLGFDRDPEFYDTAIDGIADMTPDDGWRMSRISYAETLYDRPMILAYRGLDPSRSYRLRITYAGEGYHAPMRLVANGGLELQPPTDRPANPTTVELDLPRAATASGALTLQWTGPLDGGGSGRGHQVAEVWLIPASPASSPSESVHAR
jgi:hypothetical protein